MLAGIFLVLVGMSLVQELRRRYLLEQQIRALRADIETSERRVQELTEFKRYIATDAYVERVAREKLNYQKTGERVVVLPETPPRLFMPEPAPSSPPVSSPARAWLNLLFGPG
jgi:cell division protein FtsB